MTKPLFPTRNGLSESSSHFARFNALIDGGWPARLSRLEICVWLSYERCADPQGNCWPSPTKIAAKLDVPVKSILRARANLKKLGLFSIIDTGGGRSAAKVQVLQPSPCTNLPHGRGRFTGEVAPSSPVQGHPPQKRAASNKEEQLIQHTKEQTINDPPGFIAFWSIWPAHERKVGRKQCLAKWMSVQLESKADRIISAVEQFKKSDSWARGFIPMPLTWLNQERWEAENIGRASTNGERHERSEAGSPRGEWPNRIARPEARKAGFCGSLGADGIARTAG